MLASFLGQVGGQWAGMLVGIVARLRLVFKERNARVVVGERDEVVHLGLVGENEVGNDVALGAEVGSLVNARGDVGKIRAVSS